MAADFSELRSAVLKNLVRSDIVARPHDLELLIGKINDIRKNQGGKSFVIIEAESGSGKTQLLKQASARISNARVIYKKCQPHDAYNPYGIIGALIRNLFDSEELKGIIRRSLSERRMLILSQIAPDISGTAVAETDFERQELYDLVIFMLKIASEFSDVVYLLDNGHYADEPSYLVIHGFASVSNRKPVVVITTNHKDASKIPHFIEFKTLNIEFCDKLMLNPLSREESDNFTRKLLTKGRVSDKLLGAVYKFTRGQPCDITLLLKSCLQKGILTFDNDIWDIKGNLEELPLNDINEIIYDNMSTQKAEQIETLMTASVAGEVSELDILKQALLSDNKQLTKRDIEQQLQALIEEGFLEEFTEGGKKEIGFVAEKIQQILYDTIHDKTRQSKHKTIAMEHEKKYAGALEKVLPQLVRHFSRSNDEQKASHYKKELDQKTGKVYSKAEVTEYINKKAGTFQARVAELRHPLDESSCSLVYEFFAALLNAMHVTRLYPEGAIMVKNASKECLDKLMAALSATKGFTVSMDENNLCLNDRTFGEGSLQKKQMLILDLLRIKKIQSLTFTQSFATDDFSKLIKLMNSEISGSFIAEDYWEKLFEKEGLESIWPVTYSYSTYKSTGLSREDAAAVEAITGLNGLLELARIYPVTNLIISEKTDQLITVISSLKSDTDSSTISINNDDILFNGRLIASDEIKGRTTELKKMFNRFGINSIIFRGRAEKGDLIEFINLLNDTRTLSNAEAAAKLKEFRPATLEFTEKELQRKIAGDDVLKTMPAEERARLYLQKSDEGYMSITEDSMVELIFTLEKNGNDLWLDLVRRYKTIVDKNDRNAKEAGVRLISIADKTFNITCDKVDFEFIFTNEILSGGEAREFLVRYIEHLYTGGDEQLLDKYLRLVFEEEASDLQVRISTGIICKDLERSFKILPSETLAKCVSAAGKQADLARILTGLSDAADDKLTDILRHSSETKNELVNLLISLDDAKCAALIERIGIEDSLTKDFIIGLCNSGKSLSLKSLSDRVKSSGSPLLRQTFSELLRDRPGSAERRALISLMLDIRMEGLESEISDILANETSEEVIMTCIKYLIFCPHNESKDRLKRIITAKKGLFRRYEFSKNIRANAIIALSKYNDADVISFLKGMLNDKDNDIQAAAYVAFNSLKEDKK